MDARNLSLADGTEEDAEGAAALGTAGGRIEVRAVIRRKDGSTFPAEVRVSAFELDGRIYRQAIGVDISDRVRLEQQVLRLSRVKRSLQAATSILLRARSEADNLRSDLHRPGRIRGYRMVAVAVARDDPGKTVTYASIAGYDGGDLERTHTTWNDEPTGNGPLGMAIQDRCRPGQPGFRQQSDSMAVARGALRHEYRSSIVLPLQPRDGVAAALVIYAAEPKAFDAEEVQLLTALADDISYARCRVAS
jgi:PAS domain-containing protein